MNLETFDLGVVAIYAVALLGIALWVSREPKGTTKNTEDYFLAGRALPWWAIGASLIAANISAEQITGQSGDGLVMGLAIAAYEWQAAIVLIIVAKYFLPIFLKREIYTMPQFLETRYGTGVKTLMSVYWIALYTIVNLTAILWLGAVTIEQVAGVNALWAMVGLAAFAAVYSLYGGLKAVALTDIIQVVILITGGVAITWIALDLVSGGEGPISGFKAMTDAVPGHFQMIFERSNENYDRMPGIWTLLGGLWVLHFSYWGFNQYIIQRALGAENLAEAQKGLAFAAFLKLLIPLIVVIPGIAALMLATNGTLDASSINPAVCSLVDGQEVCGNSNRTYGALMTLAPVGLRGLIFAALIAAIVSSLASMMNSISTIFTMDIYRDYIVRNQSEKHYVTVGRVAAFVAIAFAVIAAKPIVGSGGSVFQTIQEYTGFIAPGIVAVFLLGFFWKRANASGAFAILLGSLALSLLFYAAASPGAVSTGLHEFAVGTLSPVFNPILGLVNFSVTEMPFVVRIWFVFLISVLLGMLVSVVTPKPGDHQPVILGDIGFATRASFNIAAIVVMILLIAIYVVFW